MASTSSFFKKNGPTPASFCLFSSFQTNITNFTTNMNVKKCPSSIRRWDSNSQPCDYESPPLTTRPGLPPRNTRCYDVQISKTYLSTTVTSMSWVRDCRCLTGSATTVFCCAMQADNNGNVVGNGNGERSCFWLFSC